jgi:Zn-dependent metalloprotease
MITIQKAACLLAVTVSVACGPGSKGQLSQTSEQQGARAQTDEFESGSAASVLIYNGSTVLTIPNPLNRGVLVMKDGKRTLEGLVMPLLLTRQVRAAHKNFASTLQFYADQFGRNGYDGEGSPVRAAVELQRYHLLPLFGLKNNAAWMDQFNHFVFGAGDSKLGGFSSAIDVVAHEFTHAVISSTSNLQYVGQSGAVNEHLADVFGEFVQHVVDPASTPFLIGETVLRGEYAQKAKALRDMLNPAKGLSVQPGHMNEIPDAFGTGCKPAADNDNCGVHILSGIPNKAVALMIGKLGWDALYQLFYTVMTERLNETSDFAEYRDAVVSECRATLPAASCQVVVQSFAAVGL